MRRRGIESARVGLASEHRIAWTRASNRQHVADGNRRPGLRQPVRHRTPAHETRFGNGAPARDRGGHRHARGRAGWHRPEGHHGTEAALPRDDARPVG